MERHTVPAVFHAYFFAHLSRIKPLFAYDICFIYLYSLTSGFTIETKKGGCVSIERGGLHAYLDQCVT